VAAALAAVSLLVSCGGGGEAAPELEAQAAALADGRAHRLGLPVGTPVNIDAHIKGQFGPVKNWPVIPIHVALTADGRVLGYGSSTTGQQTANRDYAVWDPTPDETSDEYSTLANGTGTDIFCSSQILLPAGDQVFIAGGDNWTGTGTNNQGNNNSNLFNATANALTRTANMNRARWYSSSTMLLNGEILIQGGAGGLDRPEIRAADGAFRLLSSADTTPYNWDFPRNFAAPDGRLFGFDTGGRMYWLNPTGNGSVTSAGAFPSATAGGDSTGAMFSPGRILQFGGNSNAAIVIDITSGAPSVTSTSALAYHRRLGTATVLADGKVLASGGSIEWNVMNSVAYEAEIWNPATGQWTRGATHTRARLYHSVALLLPDATVMVGGGGAPGPQNNLNHEIFYPPYLFKSDRTEAARPAIATAPTVVDTGRTVQVSVTHNRPVARVTFVKSGSVTHGWNMDQRFVDLPFNAQGGQLSVQIPGRASDVPPGMWMMFVIDADGVPSVAKMMRVNVAAALNTAVVPSIGSPGNQSSTVGTAVNLALTATDPNSDPLTYSASGLPPGLSINDASGLISGTPTTAGIYKNVTVAVTDGFNSANTTFDWSVAGTTLPLVLTPPTPLAPTVSGSTATFSASATGANPRYSWNFGDGSAATAYAVSGAAAHSYAAPGVYYATVTVTDDSGATQWQTVMHQVFLSSTAQAPSISASIAYETRSGLPARVWVVNADNDSVSVFDTTTRERVAEIAVGAAPR
jgi:YVTN family beta-propeller protein